MQAVISPSVPAPHHEAGTVALAAPALSARELRWAAALALGYFGAQIAMRVAISPALELDEAEQALWTQRLQLGYGPQPPLYTWLQMLVFQLLGPSVLGLAVLKNLLLATTYGSLWLAGRRLMPSPLAATAALCPLLILQIGWESQRDLTHSVLATTMASVSFLMLLRLLERPQALARWAALGLALGLGALSKYSFGAYAAALLAAALALPQGRAALRAPRAWVGAALLAGVALAVFAPNLLWLLEHSAMASEHALGKLSGEPMPRWRQIASGVGSFTLAMLAFLSPLWLLLLGLFGAAWWRRAGVGTGAPVAPPQREALARRLGRNYALALVALFLVLVVVGGASQFKDRWMQPLLVIAPVLAFAVAPWLAHHPRRRVLHLCCAVAALVWLVGIGARVPLAPARANPDELNEPVAALAAALRSEGAIPPGHYTLVSNDRVLAGSLRLQFAQARAVVAVDTRALRTLLSARAAEAAQTGVAPLLIVLRAAGPDAAALRDEWARLLAAEPADSKAPRAFGWTFPLHLGGGSGLSVSYVAWLQR